MIKDELILLFTSLYCGIIFAIVYDAIRIIRNLIKPHFIRVVIEDFIYWICVAYIFFSMLIKKNYGNLRWYPIFGMLLAMAVYEIIVGRKLVLKISKVLEKIIRTLLKPLKKAWKRIKLRKTKIEEKFAKGNKVIRCRKKENHRKACNADSKTDNR